MFFVMSANVFYVFRAQVVFLFQGACRMRAPPKQTVKQTNEKIQGKTTISGIYGSGHDDYFLLKGACRILLVALINLKLKGHQ